MIFSENRYPLFRIMLQVIEQPRRDWRDAFFDVSGDQPCQAN